MYTLIFAHCERIAFNPNITFLPHPFEWTPQHSCNPFLHFLSFCTSLARVGWGSMLIFTTVGDELVGEIGERMRGEGIEETEAEGSMGDGDEGGVVFEFRYGWQDDGDSVFVSVCIRISTMLSNYGF